MMLKGIFYIISYIGLLTGIFLVKKSDKKLNTMSWIVVSVMISFCCQAFTAAFLYKTGLYVGNLSIGAGNIIIAVVLWITIARHGLQKYDIQNISDRIAFAIIFLVAGLVYVFRFALGRDINFASVDSAAAYNMAGIVALDHYIPTNMFFAAINSAMPMEAGLPITGSFYMFRTFLLWETGYFFLSGASFYILVRRALNKKGQILIGIIVTIIYMLGYPLYSMIFGFSYFGLSISLITLIIYSAALLIDGELYKPAAYIILNLLLFSLFLCYMMFVPAVFSGVLLAIVINISRTDRVMSLRTIKEGLSIFLAPSILGLLITIANLTFISHDTVVSGDSSGSKGIAMDGGCYNDMYSNFIMLLPFVIAGIVLCIRRIRVISGEMLVTASIFTTMIIFMIILFTAAMKGYVSVYYYVKNNNVVALLGWAIFIFAMSYSWDKSREIYSSFILVVSIALVMIFTEVDESILDRNSRFLRVGVESFLNIYSFNHELNTVAGEINSDDVRIYEYALNNLDIYETIDNPQVAVIGGAVYTAWYEKMTSNSNVTRINDIETLQQTDLSEYKYICVQNSEIYDLNREMFDNIPEMIYSNTRGMIIQQY